MVTEGAHQVSCASSRRLPNSKKRNRCSEEHEGDAPKIINPMSRHKALTSNELCKHRTIPCARLEQTHSCQWGNACKFSHVPDPARIRRTPKKEKGVTDEYEYEPVLCPSMEAQGKCEEGDACRMAHSTEEIWFHPSVYKKIRCPREAVTSTCEHIGKESCPHLHKDEWKVRKMNKNHALTAEIYNRYLQPLLLRASQGNIRMLFPEEYSDTGVKEGEWTAEAEMKKVSHMIMDVPIIPVPPPLLPSTPSSSELSTAPSSPAPVPKELRDKDKERERDALDESGDKEKESPPTGALKRTFSFPASLPSASSAGLGMTPVFPPPVPPLVGPSNHPRTSPLISLELLRHAAALQGLQKASVSMPSFEPHLMDASGEVSD
uniref:C3H1-type domain-containing protein n=1 Tax=Chromera velia CCMP2878 TaxID=1169474 RepID=A0A0G4IEG4_9ALVE|eukprot:Cvel_13667.t1-p1 / transcript=Cvel_13667.t1 / gene=Cvel_13667 / organism=Chromera_velia_CCMP2878 / gene_product=Zinc finger CCCH domain-containing protein 33, putative / transcript_product=Zinc finger CCCH domain-containing protein 33, putative / location=Cvel_scaffold943:41345-45214(+) / protein_length=376 / sequence_SO=supercontig / SO=protein_coding / is_pseudo=false